MNKRKIIVFSLLFVFIISFIMISQTLSIYRETKSKSVNFTVEHPTFTVSFSVNGGSGGQSSSINAKYGEAMPTLSSSIPTMTDYIFMGYFDAPSGGTKYYNADLTSAHTFDKAGDTTLYAQWVSVCINFTNDTWAEIVDNVQDGDYSRYPVGCTKEVTLGNSLGIHTLRVANNSNYDCSLDSQTACGFVLEFADIITTHSMNSAGEYNGVEYEYGWNVDGWPASGMRTYLNDTNNSTSIYNSIPTVIKNAIIDTTVISGYEQGKDNNYLSVDKLYLLSTKEVYGKEGATNVVVADTAEIETRQLDYYLKEGVTTVSGTYTSASKKYNDSYYRWWLRTAVSNSMVNFYRVYDNGNWNLNSATYANGVSPAFRLAGPESLTYNINYTMNGGEKGLSGPTMVIYNKVFEVTKPTKTFTVSIDANSQGVSVTNSVSSSQVFAGWSASSLDVVNAKYGTSSDNVTTSWNSSSTQVGANDNAIYFKNLAQSGNTVTLVANWTPTAVTLPTISKTGYTCSFNTEADGSGMSYASGGSYTPSATEGNTTLYVRCVPNIYEITLDNQSATTAGTATIYEKYGNGYYLNNTATTQMGTNSNGITIPTKTGYIFNGYYTGTSGSGTKYIDENGYITTNASNTNFTVDGQLYAYWTLKPLTVNDVSIYYSNTEEKLYVSGGIEGETVVIEVNNNTYNRTLGQDGKTSLSIIGLNVGEYPVTVTRNIDNSIISSTITVLSTIDSSDLTKIYRSGNQFLATFLDNSGNPLVTTNVYFNFGGVQYIRATNDSGIAKLNINANPGIYGITFTNPSTGETRTNTITVLSTIDSSDLTKFHKSGQQFSATFLDGSGNPLVNTNVYFDFAGVQYTRTTNASGIARLNINADPGIYEITVTNPSTLETRTNTITVLSRIISSDLEKIYGDDSNQFNVTILDSEGVPLSGAAVTFTISSVIYNRTTNASGIATLNIDKAPGIYEITVAYLSTGETKTNTITVLYDDDTKIIVNLNNENATVTGTSTIYAKKDGLYLDDTKKMTMTANPITKPTKTGYTFGGYYTATNGEGIQFIDENGYITANASNTNYTLYAQWTTDPCASFTSDSWATIVSNVQSGNYSRYPVGCTKTLSMTVAGLNSSGTSVTQTKTHTLRVANNSNYNCSLSSKTACGFVLEFADVITYQKMNSTNTNTGGWESSAMRTYVNNTIYNALPSELKSGIIDTTVISGYESGKSSNYETTDKIYLLSTLEVNSQNSYDTVTSSHTRVLDYYTGTDNATRVKYESGGSSGVYWWLRSAPSNYAYGFLIVNSRGSVLGDAATSTRGVSPAFRLKG